ncbi:MAG: response regulator [Nitrospinota bacterium]
MKAKKRLLLVDDDEAHLLWASEVLEENGFEIISSKSSKEALELIKKERIDLIISDLVMPEMGGIEFVKKIADIKADQRVIIMTGHGDIDSYIESRYNLGALEYIGKPIKIEEFLKVINEVIAN